MAPTDKQPQRAGGSAGRPPPFRTRRVPGRFTAPLRPRTRATRPCRHVRSRCTETTEPRGVCGRARALAWRASCAPRNDYRQVTSSGWSSSLDHWRSRRNRVYRMPRVGRSHFGGGGSGSRSAVPTYPQPPHKWTTSPDSGRTGGSLRASRIASPHWGHRGAVSGSFRTSMLGNQCGEHFRPRRSTGQYCSLTCRKASARFRTVSVPQLRNGGVDDIAHYRLPQPLARAKRRHPGSGIARHARHETQLKAFHRERVEHCVPLLRPTAYHYHEGNGGHENVRIQNNHRCCGARAGCGRG